MLITIILFCIGLIAGSFINALVWRTEQEKSIAKGRSMCPHCKHVLAPKDLVPIFSWLWLRGRCRYCKKQIGWHYPLVELATGVLFAASYLFIRPAGLLDSIEFSVWLYVLGSLVFLTVYDLKWMILPDKVLLPAVIVVLAWFGVKVVFFGMPPSVLLGPILAATATAIAFGALAKMAGGRLMGGGDVKLVALMGLLLGMKHMALALFAAFNIAAAVGLLLIALRVRGRRDHIPFGPFLALGTALSYVYGTPIINLYLKAIGLQ